MSRSIIGLVGRRCSLTCLFIGIGSTSKTSGRPRSKAGANLLELDVLTGANLAPVPLADMATRVLLLKSPLALTPAGGFVARGRLPSRFFNAFGPCVVVVAFS